jgi:photosystem II stability/assembly factor-like uncharacterized protein
MKDQSICFRILLAIVMLVDIVPLHAQWVKTSGPVGSHSLVSGFNNSGAGFPGTTVFAGSDSGVYRSIDTGMSWTEVNTGLTNTTVRTLIATSSGLFAGTGGGVFRSTNTGSTWVAVNSGLTNLSIRAFSFRSGSLYAGTDGGVYRTTNGGVSWEALNTGLTHTAIRAITASGSMLLAGTDGGGIYRTTNGGVSWEALNTGLASLNIRAIVDQGVSAAATDSGVFRLTSGGAWAAIKSGLTNQNVFSLIDIPYPFGVAVAGTEGGVFRANDFYSSVPHWTAISEGMTDFNVRAVALASSGNSWDGYLLASTNSGIWRRNSSQVVPASIRPRTGSPAHFRINPTGSVSFTLNYPTRVTLTAYTPSGQKAAVLLSQEFPAGAHNHRVDAAALANMPTGLYVYRLRVGDVTESRTVVRTR